jgi:prepilin-type N-terminal cleavage/methylation domain-containing protein
MARRGLTLIELLIVLGVIALLISLSLPVLLRARNQARAAVCVQNLKTLSLGWLLYKDDNDDRLAGGQVGVHPYDWVQKPTGAGTFIEQRKQGIREGVLFRYVGEEVGVYRCPADQRKLEPGQLAFRSYSVAGGAHGEAWPKSNPTYVPATKYSEIRRPAGKYIFVEEADPRGWNQGSWVLNPQTGTWVDPLAIWHSRARSALGYADGHAEVRRWVDDSTIAMSRGRKFFFPVPPGEGEDLAFMLRGFPRKAAETPHPPGASRVPL